MAWNCCHGINGCWIARKESWNFWKLDGIRRPINPACCAWATIRFCKWEREFFTKQLLAMNSKHFTIDVFPAIPAIFEVISWRGGKGKVPSPTSMTLMESWMAEPDSNSESHPSNSLNSFPTNNFAATPNPWFPRTSNSCNFKSFTFHGSSLRWFLIIHSRFSSVCPSHLSKKESLCY